MALEEGHGNVDVRDIAEPLHVVEEVINAVFPTALLAQAIVEPRAGNIMVMNPAAVGMPADRARSVGRDFLPGNCGIDPRTTMLALSALHGHNLKYFGGNFFFRAGRVASAAWLSPSSDNLRPVLPV